MNELAHIETVVFLQSVDLFHFCSAEEILRISTIVTERKLEAGEVVYEINKSPDALYCVVRGGVTLVDGNGRSTAVGPLSTFGVDDILSGRLRSATATADAEGLVLAIAAPDFFDLLANNIDIVKSLFREFFQRTAAPDRVA